MEIRVDKETIWHFTCSKCHGWWSIASMDDWYPKKLFCTHCGEPCYNIERKENRKN